MEGFARKWFGDQIVLPLSVFSVASVLKEIACNDATDSIILPFHDSLKKVRENPLDPYRPRSPGGCLRLRAG
jgi:hypothetical protein